MQNRCIEIHDSELDGITFDGPNVLLHFSHVYIHASAGRPGIDQGTGWGQEAVIRIINGSVEGSFLEESRTLNGGIYILSDGELTTPDAIFGNVIPIPLEVVGPVKLQLECWGEIVRIAGDSATLELIGEARYIEDFQPPR